MTDDDFELKALVEEIVDRIMAEATACGPIKPLTPEQGRARQKRKDKAAADLNDTRAINAIKLRKAQAKVADL